MFNIPDYIKSVAKTTWTSSPSSELACYKVYRWKICARDGYIIERDASEFEIFDEGFIFRDKNALGDFFIRHDQVITIERIT